MVSEQNHFIVIIYQFGDIQCYAQVVIDVRNKYETRIGKFRGAVDPCTIAFRNFAHWVDEQFDLNESNKQDLATSIEEFDDRTESVVKEGKKLPRVAMYCTGGIRCEKASSFLLSKGFEEVFFILIVSKTYSVAPHIVNNGQKNLFV